MSDFFRSQTAYCAPCEVSRRVGRRGHPAKPVASPIRSTTSRRWRWPARYMGQDLMNPPSVEGWHTGQGVDRHRQPCRADQLRCGSGWRCEPARASARIIDELREMQPSTPEQFVDQCVELVGPLAIKEGTYAVAPPVRRAGRSACLRRHQRCRRRSSRRSADPAYRVDGASTRWPNRGGAGHGGP